MRVKPVSITQLPLSQRGNITFASLILESPPHSGHPTPPAERGRVMGNGDRPFRDLGGHTTEEGFWEGDAGPGREGGKCVPSRNTQETSMAWDGLKLATWNRSRGRGKGVWEGLRLSYSHRKNLVRFAPVSCILEGPTSQVPTPLIWIEG